MLEIAIWAIVFLLIGLGVGYLFYLLAQNQIKVRCEKIPQLAEDYNPNFLKGKKKLLLWELINCVLYLSTYLLNYQNIVKIIFGCILASCLLNIAAVDWSIRRIPNELLLVILISSLIYNIVEPIAYSGTQKYDDLKNNFIFSILGIVLSLVVFALPKQFGLYMGNGDIKLSASVGFALGIFGSLQAMVIMTLVMLIVLVFLRVTNKGGLKTKCPMGPALALGTMISFLFPIVASRVTILW